ncbi:rod shape-determining protein MreC [candidate division WWE3 bacterium RIFCSPHIGHO2_01_FULL_40_23]|uniref:Cell shape-determining protein MreC n=1 Tax=candidate division WWE3 bacterium RIFCSPLOWO2_01_FULL_41_18 TaxID=1802625 RepID=A0A1F4VE50_UNCKA|nr:MAG: rod shape-determining protein MreC [candidate division WWE3 bacterium RIFCSPHIGHO2_01_FULL_40_23]OGC55511.1 MAG: rod shape-determining protein MreC [candidate division WWE3 bacterium RIFCSPLOWO2_01_FULL_41_18]
MSLSLKYLFISLCIFLLGFTGVFTPLRNFAHKVSNPVSYGLHQIADEVRKTFEFFISLKKIRHENLRLREENLSLFSKISNTKELEDENKVLREQLALGSFVSRDKLIEARVIGLPFDNENSEVLIDKGKKDGVLTGQEVIYKGFLVGSVVDAFEERAVVVFITSPKLSVAVSDQSVDGRTKGLVTGSYGTSLIMDRILQDEEINVGDYIVTSGGDGIFDPGLLVGKVVEVFDDKSEPLKKAKLEVSMDFGRLDRLFVVVK